MSEAGGRDKVGFASGIGEVIGAVACSQPASAIAAKAMIKMQRDMPVSRKAVRWLA